MDRIEFSKSINIDPVTQVKDCFDEVMALYDLIEGIDYEYIHGLIEEDEQHRVVFSISFMDEHTANAVMHNVNAQHMFIIYEKQYSVSSKATDNILDIEMILI